MDVNELVLNGTEEVKLDKLKVDIHEDKMFEHLKNQGIEFDVETLPIGDYVYKDVCIERKTMPDFVQSVKSGHIQKQLLQMGENFKFNYLLLVGSYHEIETNPYLCKWTLQHHCGMIARINASYTPKIVQVENHSQAAMIIPKLIEKSLDGKIPSIVDTELMKSRVTTNDIKLKMMCSLPNIGIERGQKLLEQLDIRIINKDGRELTSDDLLSMYGIGEKLAETVLKINRGKDE